MEGPDGIPQKGAQYVTTRSLLGQKIKSRFEVDDVQPNSGYSLHTIDKGPVQVHVRIGLTPDGDGTRMSTHMEAEVRKTFKVAENLVGKKMRDQIIHDGLGLKKMLEENG